MLAMAIIVVLVWLGYQGYAQYLAPAPSPPTPTPASSQADIEPEVVSAEGTVVPQRYARLSFSLPGTVEEVLVIQGEQVETGQLLARLKGEVELDAAESAALLELTSAQQDLDALYEVVELAAAQAQMSLVEAQQYVKDAERLVNNMNSKPSEEQIQAAEAAVLLAERKLERARNALKEIPKRAEYSVRRAAAQLVIYAAEQIYSRAVSYLNALQGSPSELDIARAEANLALAMAQLHEAEKQHERLKAGPDPKDVELAQARLDNARAQLAAIQSRRGDLELRAPFSGEIVSLTLKVGEVVSPATPQLVLADLSRWQVETIDLTERDVGLLAPGMRARITLNAFPDREFEGILREIALSGVERRGAVTYPVWLDFEAGDLPVRWEMTAFVDILLP